MYCRGMVQYIMEDICHGILYLCWCMFDPTVLGINPTIKTTNLKKMKSKCLDTMKLGECVMCLRVSIPIQNGTVGFELSYISATALYHFLNSPPQRLLSSLLLAHFSDRGFMRSDLPLTILQQGSCKFQQLKSKTFLRLF